MQDFYRKTIYDWVDAMNDSVFVDTAPYVGVKYCGISWESAFLTTQYYLYLYYNDTDIIKELYALDNQWMDKAARIHPEGMVHQGLSDHESLEPVPVELIGTGHYLQCARIMETFAEVMGDQANKEKYGQLARRLKEQIKAEFWDKPVTGKINRQTLFSTLLYHDVIPAGEIEAAKDSLLNAVQNGPSGHFYTGIFGTKYILEMLSEHVSPDAVFDIVNSTEYPGWGFMIDRGATTIWETWKESDNTYSNCHPMFGTVTEWYYRWLGGIRPDPDHPGFEEFVLAPATPEGLESVRSAYHSPLGTIVSNWRKESTGSYQYEMTVPEGSAANVRLPLTSPQEIAISEKQGKIEPGKIEGLETGRFQLSGGEYLITITQINQQ
jgi:alpha-L-rhamnosidase